MAEPKEGYNSGIYRVVSSGAIDSDGNYVAGAAALSKNTNFYPAPSSTYTANFYATTTALAPANSPAITAASIPRITAAQVPADTRRIYATCSADDTAGNLHWGWLIVLNAATEADADTALTQALKNNATGDLLSYGVLMEASGDSNVIFVPKGHEMSQEAQFDIVTVFAIPVASNTSAVGTSFLQVTLMPAPA